MFRPTHQHVYQLHTHTHTYTHTYTPTHTHTHTNTYKEDTATPVPTLLWLLMAASCRGDSSPYPKTFTLAPAFRSCLATSTLPRLQASWSGVQPEKGGKIQSQFQLGTVWRISLGWKQVKTVVTPPYSFVQQSVCTHTFLGRSAWEDYCKLWVTLLVQRSWGDPVQLTGC